MSLLNNIIVFFNKWYYFSNLTKLNANLYITKNNGVLTIRVYFQLTLRGNIAKTN